MIGSEKNITHLLEKIVSSNVIVNLIGYFVLQQGGNKSLLFIIFGILAVVGSLLFCILRSPAKEEK